MARDLEVKARRLEADDGGGQNVAEEGAELKMSSLSSCSNCMSGFKFKFKFIDRLKKYRNWFLLKELVFFPA